MSQNNRAKTPKATIKRNWVAKHQYQRGGVHEKPHKAHRLKKKQQLKHAIRSQSAADFFAYFQD